MDLFVDGSFLFMTFTTRSPPACTDTWHNIVHSMTQATSKGTSLLDDLRRRNHHHSHTAESKRRTMRMQMRDTPEDLLRVSKALNQSGLTLLHCQLAPTGAPASGTRSVHEGSDCRSAECQNLEATFHVQDACSVVTDETIHSFGLTTSAEPSPSGSSPCGSSVRISTNESAAALTSSSLQGKMPHAGLLRCCLCKEAAPPHPLLTLNCSPGVFVQQRDGVFQFERCC
jgi:hypothetical protein